MVEWVVKPTIPMKLCSTFVTPTVLLCAAALVSSAAAAADSGFAPPVALRLEVDRSVLPADSIEKAILKVCFDGVQPPCAVLSQLRVEQSAVVDERQIRHVRVERRHALGAAELDRPIPAISQHLAKMRMARLVVTRRAGSSVMYRV